VTRSRAALTALLILLGTLAACGIGGSPRPSAFPASPQELQALIPEEVDGISLQRLSMSGSEFVASGNATEETQQFLESLGVSTDAVSVAAGFGASPEDGHLAVVFIFRADGAPTDRLVSAFQQAANDERGTALGWQPATVGGKHVERASDPEAPASGTAPGQSLYVYARDSVLVFVATTEESDAARILEGMP
jgi:hypothetical protein